MLNKLTTESQNPASAHIDTLSPVEIARLMNREDAAIADAVAGQIEPIGEAIDAIAEALRAGGRLVYLGAGTSGRLGVLDASECPPTFSTPPEMVVGLIAGGRDALTRSIEGAEDRPEDGARDLQSTGLGQNDVVAGIASSGRTPYVLGGLTYARSLGCVTIGVCCNAAAELSEMADILVCPVVGPEVVSGSTRLKAGTATKMILNMFTTGAMVRLGKTYGNLMVDLTAANEKLTIRSQNIVRQFTDLSAGKANDLLVACNGELKTAIVAHCKNLSPEKARRRLESVDGQLRRALTSE